MVDPAAFRVLVGAGSLSRLCWGVRGLESFVDPAGVVEGPMLGELVDLRVPEGCGGGCGLVMRRCAGSRAMSHRGRPALHPQTGSPRR